MSMAADVLRDGEGKKGETLEPFVPQAHCLRRTAMLLPFRPRSPS